MEADQSEVSAVRMLEVSGSGLGEDIFDNHDLGVTLHVEDGG